MNSVSIAPSTTTWATWMFFGPSSRAMLWASARSACLAPAKAAKLADPRSDAVAPVNRIVPRSRGPMRPPGLLGVAIEPLRPGALQLLQRLLHARANPGAGARDLAPERRQRAAGLGMLRVVHAEVAVQALRHVVGGRVGAGQHVGAVLQFAPDQLGEQVGLGGEVAVERAARQADGGHERIDASGIEAALLGDRAAAVEQPVARLLLVRGGVAHGFRERISSV